MTLRYFAARLKRTAWPMLAGSAALFIVALSLIVAVALPPILNTALTAYNKQLCGDADIVLTNASDTADRFFGLTALRGDGILSSNSIYINGYFKAYARIASKGADGEYCTLFAADFQKQNEYNPIVSDNLPEILWRDDIIVGADYAESAGLLRGDTVNILFGGKTAEFTIACIAGNEGLFHSGNAVFINSDALRHKLGLPFGSEIVTHCFIKAKDGAALSAVTERLETAYARLDFAPAADAAIVSDVKSVIAIPAICIAVIVSVFCLISLTVLLRLTFARDRENFALLRTLGASRGQLAAVTALTGLLMCAVSLPAAYFASLAVQHFGAGMMFLLRDFRIGALPYIVGLGGGFIAGMACAFLGSFATPPATKGMRGHPFVPKGWTRNGRGRFLPFVIFALSAVFSIAGVLTIRRAPYLGLAFIVLALAGFIFTLPKAAAPLFSALHRGFKNIYTLRLKTLSRSPDWQKFVSFIIAGALVLLTVMLPGINARNYVGNDYPFDIVVTEIRSASEGLFRDVSEAAGTAGAVKAELHLNARLSAGGLTLNGSFLALEKDGFDYFGADFGLAQEYGGTGAVVGSLLASQRNLRRGDTFTLFRGADKIEFTVAGVVKSDYLGGNFILADLARVAAEARPYSEILVKADGAADLKDVIAGIDSAVSDSVSVLDIKALGGFLSGFFWEFIGLLDVLCAAIAVLTALTVLLMIVMRRSARAGEAPRLRPLGLTVAADVRHNLFSAFFALLPIAVFLPFLILILCRASSAVYYGFGVRMEMNYLAPVVFTAAAAFLAFIALTETLICRLFSRRKT